MERKSIGKQVNKMVFRREFMIKRIKRRKEFILLIVHVNKRTIQTKSLLESQSFKGQITEIIIDGSIRRKNWFIKIVRLLYELIKKRTKIEVKNKTKEVIWDIKKRFTIKLI